MRPLSTVINTATPVAEQSLTGRVMSVFNQPGYPSIGEFGSAGLYNGSDLYAAAPVVTYHAAPAAMVSATPQAPAVTSPAAAASSSAADSTGSASATASSTALPAPASASASAAPPAAASASLTAAAPGPVAPSASKTPAIAPSSASAASAGSRLYAGARAAAYLTSIGYPTAPAPLKVVYIDWRDVNWNDMSVTVRAACAQGWNLIILSFWMGSAGPVDAALTWSTSPAANRAAALHYCHSVGALVGLSAGGSTDMPYGTSAASYGSNAAAFMLASGLDALDFDMENFGPGLTAQGTSDAISWLVTTTQAARAAIGPGPLIMHAPQAPYFGPIGAAGAAFWSGTGGGYTAVWQRSAGAIDALLVQFCECASHA